jgi:hypothetical protein
MNVNYSADVSTIDQPPHDAKAERPDKTIRIRVPLLLFRLRPGSTPGTGSYRSWNDVSWILECESVDEALRTRDTLQVFFAAVGAHGIEAVHQLLTADAPEM